VEFETPSAIPSRQKAGEQTALSGSQGTGSEPPRDAGIGARNVLTRLRNQPRPWRNPVAPVMEHYGDLTASDIERYGNFRTLMRTMPYTLLMMQ